MNSHQRVLYETLRVFDQLCVKHSIPYVLDFGTLLGAIRDKGFIPWDDDIDIAMLRKDYEEFCRVVVPELPDYLVLQNHVVQPKYLSLLPKIRNTTYDIQEYAFRNVDVTRGAWLDIFIYDNIPDDLGEREKYLTKVVRKHDIFFLQNSVYGITDRSHPKEYVKAALARVNKLLSHSKMWRRHIRKSFFSLETLVRKYENVSCADTTTTHFRSSKKELKGTALSTKDFDNVIRWQFEDASFPVPANYDLHLRKLYGNYWELPPENERKPKHPLG